MITKKLVKREITLFNTKNAKTSFTLDQYSPPWRDMNISG